MSLLTPEMARELLEYDPETGALTWRVSTSRRVKVGGEAGHISADGYRRIKVYGRRYGGHRLAWLMVHGVWPSDQIDHINGDPSDNRLCNLREATPSENQQNKYRPQSNNKAGYLGVFWHKAAGKYAAQIKVNRRHKHLGLFATAGLAHAAYLAAKREFHQRSAL